MNSPIEITQEQCRDFLKSPSYNPLTGRKIKKGKITHKKLMKLCESQKKSPSKQAPPMGPILLADMDTTPAQSHKVIDNIFQIIVFINGRLKHFKTESEFSLLEINDIISQLKHCSKFLINNEHLGYKPNDIKNYIPVVPKLIDIAKDIKKNKNVINDLPKPIKISHHEITKNRFEIREEIMYIYGFFTHNLSSIERQLKKDDIDTKVHSKVIYNLIEKKKYIDYVISHKIFSHDDIYTKVFKNPNVWTDLGEKYRLYSTKYEKQFSRLP